MIAKHNHICLLQGVSKLCRVISAMFICSLIYISSALSDPHALATLETTVLELEERLDARIGVLILESGSDWQWGHRENERFLMASTFKSVLCGAVLDRVDQGDISLNERIEIHAQDILSYAPITEKHVGASLSIGELCLATLNMSDNTAANLLINRLGGTDKINAFLRKAGDTVTRLDRIEPGLNTFSPGDPRDTTSPAAMLSTWNNMLLGGGLTSASGAQLAEWMSYGGVTGALIRTSVPEGWHVVDKSGGGREYTRNLVAMITPADKAPVFVAIFVSDTAADWSTRNAAVRTIGAAVIDVIQAR
jgi:beta-lactamase class A